MIFSRLNAQLAFGVSDVQMNTNDEIGTRHPNKRESTIFSNTITVAR